jgi:hypothetical protein
MSKTLDQVVPNPPANLTKRTLDRGPGQPVIDFVVDSAIKQSEEINRKYNSDNPEPMALIGARKLTFKQLAKRTCDNFASFIVQGKQSRPVYEYIAYIPTKADYYKSVALKRIALYLKLRVASSQMTSGKQNGESQEIAAIRKEFPTPDDRTSGLLQLESSLLSGLHRIYSIDLVAGDIVLAAGKTVTHDYGYLVPGNKTKIKSEAIADIQAEVTKFSAALKAEKQRIRGLDEVEKAFKDFPASKKKQLNPDASGPNIIGENA